MRLPSAIAVIVALITIGATFATWITNTKVTAVVCFLAAAVVVLDLIWWGPRRVGPTRTTP